MITTIGQYLKITQPGVFNTILRQFKINPSLSSREEEFTPEQKYLDKIMKQKPRPGRG